MQKSIPQRNIIDHERKENAGNSRFLFSPKESKAKPMRIWPANTTNVTGAFANTKRDENINTSWNLNRINGILLIQHFNALSIQKMISVYSQRECNNNVNAFLFVTLITVGFTKRVSKWSNDHVAISDSDNEYICVETIDRPNVSGRSSAKMSTFRNIRCLID